MKTSSDVPESYRRSLAGIDYTSPVCKINVALDRIPNFLADPNSSSDGVMPHHLAALPSTAPAPVPVGGSDADTTAAAFKGLFLPFLLRACAEPQQRPSASDADGWRGLRAAPACPPLGRTTAGSAEPTPANQVTGKGRGASERRLHLCWI